MAIKVEGKNLILSVVAQSNYINSLLLTLDLFEKDNKDFFKDKTNYSLIPILDFFNPDKSFTVYEQISVDRNSGFLNNLEVINILSKKDSMPVSLTTKESFQNQKDEILEISKKILLNGGSIESKAKYLRTIGFYEKIFSLNYLFPIYDKIIAKYDEKKRIYTLDFANYNPITNKPSFWELEFLLKDTSDVHLIENKKKYVSNIRDIFNLNPNKNQFKIIINDYLDSRKIIDSSKREIKVEKNVKLDEIIFESMYFQPELMWQRLNQDKFPIQSLKMIELDCFYFNCNQSFKKFNLAYLDLMSQFELQKEFGDNLCFLAIKKVNLKKNQNHTQQVKFYSSNNILSTYLNTSRSNVAQTYTLLEQ